MLLDITGGILFILVMCDMIGDRDTVRSSSNTYIAVNHHAVVHGHIIETSENATDKPMCLLDLL